MTSKRPTSQCNIPSLTHTNFDGKLCALSSVNLDELVTNTALDFVNIKSLKSSEGSDLAARREYRIRIMLYRTYQPTAYDVLFLCFIIEFYCIKNSLTIIKKF